MAESLRLTKVNKTVVDIGAWLWYNYFINNGHGTTGDNDMDFFIQDILVGLTVGATLGYLIFL